MGEEKAGGGIIGDAVCLRDALALVLGTLAYVTGTESGTGKERGRKRTVLDIALANLLGHLGPDGGMHLLVLGRALGLELDDLREPAAGVRGARGGPELGHDEMVG